MSESFGKTPTKRESGSDYHSPRSPSGAEMWMNCPGSIAMNEGRPEDETTYSLEGNFLHDIAADCLRFGFDAYDFLGRTQTLRGHKFTFEEEFAEKMQPGLDLFRSYPGRMYVEKRVSISKWSPGDSGTLDTGIAGKKLIVIGDWKWGEGEPVHAEENKQMMGYALGFWNDIARHITDAKEFLLIIEQPRIPHGGGTWRVDLKRLLRFGEQMKKAAAATRKPNAPRIPSAKACRWCKGFNDCPEAAEMMLKVMGQRFKNLDEARDLGVPLRPSAPEKMTPERKAQVYLHAPMIRRWLEKITSEAVSNATTGNPPPGLKAVHGRRGARYWKDPKKAEKRLARFMGEKRFNKKVKSPSQVEKELPSEQWAALGKLIDQKPGSPILVPVSDPRKPIRTVKDRFKNLDVEQRN